MSCIFRYSTTSPQALSLMVSVESFCQSCRWAMRISSCDVNFLMVRAMAMIRRYQSSLISAISRSTTFFEVMPWDSAAKFVMTRWPRTGTATASKSSRLAM